MALSKRGESASETISSRRIRCMQSTSATDSAAIQSGRSFAFAVDMTISSPRSMGSILKYFAGFRRVENQFVLVDLHIDGPVVFHLKRERWPTLCDANVVLRYRNSEFRRFLKDVPAKRFSSFSRTRRVFDFLANKVIELKSREVSWDVAR